MTTRRAGGGDRGRPASDESAARLAAGMVEEWESIARLMAGMSSPSFMASVMTESANLFGELTRIAAGTSTVAADKKDRRFSDAAWNDDPYYHQLMQAYLAWGDSVRRLPDSAGVDSKTTERARLALSQLVDAAAPTNTLFGNPEARKRALETGGQSLIRGAQQFADDLVHNEGQPSQVDKRAFALGENLAATAGAVVHRTDVFELIQYEAQTPRVHARPIVYVPPQINKFYILDLAPGRSLIEFLVRRGFTVFAVSWRNPTPRHRAWGFDTYIDATLAAVDAARAITKSDDANLLGLCAGGVTSAAAVGYLARTKQASVHSLTLLVTMLDMCRPSVIDLVASETTLALSEGAAKVRGVVRGRDLARLFSWVRPNDLVWNYWVNNYLLGKDPPAFDILFWNADSTNVAAALHHDFLDLFRRNALTTPGAAEIHRLPIDLGAVTCDAYVLAGQTDHITPWTGAYETTQLLGGSCEFVLNPSGHVQSLVNPPDNPKARFFADGDLGADADAWLASARERPGSWWEHWADWLTARSGAERAAPRRTGTRAFPSREPAPGTYIHERVD